jgi:hypothetical protein
MILQEKTALRYIDLNKSEVFQAQYMEDLISKVRALYRRKAPFGFDEKHQSLTLDREGYQLRIKIRDDVENEQLKFISWVITPRRKKIGDLVLLGSYGDRVSPLEITQRKINFILKNFDYVFSKEKPKINPLRKFSNRVAKANVNPIRQRSQFSCVATSTCMALNVVGVKCNEDQVNQVIGAKPMQGARWEEVLACAQYFGCRATLTTPATLTQVKAWTDQGKPVLIAWNPEGRDWSHASLIFDVTGEKGSYVVHVADPNMPNPDKTTREMGEDEFYSKWYEKWPNYLVRRPALMIEREICENGRQIMASKIARVHLERKKWVEAPPRQFDQNQQEQIWTIYDLSYSKVGKHISSKSTLMSNYDLFWVVDVEGDKEIDAFVSYSNTAFGKKIGLIGSDGTSEGRNAMLMKGAELLLKRGWYAEVDSRFARLLKKKLGVNHIQDEVQVRTIINKPLEWDDEKKCYSRNLEGKGEVVKYLVGIPNI